MEIKNCEEKGKLQDFMQNYSPYHKPTSLLAFSYLLFY